MKMVYGKVNGKRVSLPSSSSREDVINAHGGRVNPSTRCVIKTTSKGGRQKLKPGQRYKINKGDKFQIGPDRVKACGESYFGYKEDWRKQVIIDQVQDLSCNFFKGGEVELDDDCNWVVFNSFWLPRAWAKANPGQETCKMMLIFPDQFPDLPTNGFYLPDTLKQPAGDSHFWNRGYGGAFGGTSEEISSLAGAGWKWYCTHIKPGAWQPARIKNVSDWHYGDNLWDIITLAQEVLTDPYGD